MNSLLLGVAWCFGAMVGLILLTVAWFAHPDAPWGGGRPYLKTHYRSRAYGRLEGGFIERRKIPPKIPIGPAKELTTPEQQLVAAGIPLG